MRVSYLCLFVWIQFICPALCTEYLISLKTPKTLKYLFNFKLGGSTVKDLIESKIHREFSFGNFNAISVDIPPLVAEKLKDIPFISDVVANTKISLFDAFPEMEASLKASNKLTKGKDKKTMFIDDEEGDDDESVEDGLEFKENYTTQKSAPRHLARISRRTQLPIIPQDYDTSALKYHYHADRQGEDVHVYVLDSGINYSHPDFEGRAKEGIDTTGEGSGDFIGHGTHVAGLIGSKTYGVAKKANIYEVKVLDSLGRGNVTDIIEGLEYVVSQCQDNKKKCVVNMSLGAPGTHSILDRAVSAVIDEGIVVVVAGGNSGLNACWYSPAKVKKAITVAAMDDRTDLMAQFSNWGACVDIWAPGVNVESLSNRGDDTVTLSGTSMASPIVAGAAALFLDQGYKPSEVRKALLKYSTKGVFKKRALAVRPRSPNRLLYTGNNEKDDTFEYGLFPQIDEYKFISRLQEDTKDFNESNDPNSALLIRGRKLLEPNLTFKSKKQVK